MADEKHFLLPSITIRKHPACPALSGPHVILTDAMEDTAKRRPLQPQRPVNFEHTSDNSEPHLSSA